MKIGEKAPEAASDAAENTNERAEPASRSTPAVRFGVAGAQRTVSAPGLKRLGKQLAGTASKRARPAPAGASGSSAGVAPKPEAGAATQAAASAKSGDAAGSSRSGTRQRMTAAKLARALAIIAEDPLRARRDVAADVGIGRATLLTYIGVDGKLVGVNNVVAFPDFAANSDAIKASLRTLRHDEQIAELDSAAATGTQGAERQALTARDILRHLLDREAGGGKNPALRSWTSPSSWQRDKLAQRLSTYEGYGDVRTELEGVAKRLGLIDANAALPEAPAASRRLFDAPMLVQVLRQVRDRKRAQAEGRQDDPSLRQPLHVGVGVPPNVVAGWLSADGQLKKPVRLVSQMPGYSGVLPELRQLLTELEFADVAAQLPDGPLAAQKVSAEQIARALAMMADDRSKPVGKIAMAVGLSPAKLSGFVSRDGTFKNPEKLVRMPDFSRHADTIRDALTRMQRPDQAALLPATVKAEQSEAPLGAEPAPLPSTMTAETFLRKAEAHLSKVVEVADRVRDDPSIRLWDAAESAHVSKALLRVFFDDRGSLREARAIGQMLSGVDAYAQASIEQLTKRLHARLAHRSGASSSAGGGVGASAAERASALADAAMKPLRLKGAGRANDRVLIVDRNTVDPGPKVKGRRADIYAQNLSLVHGPRSYEPDRQRQPLRWLSTVLREHFADKDQFASGGEVQCAYDAASRTIVVSSNKVSVNKQIRDFLHSGGLEKHLVEPMPRYEGPSAERIARHHTKLADRMNPAADPHLGSASDEILAAIAERRFRVPTTRHEYDRKEVDLHAERRIKAFLRTKMRASIDPANLAGTMRPCGTCADEIGADRNAHRGPFWVSGAATAGVDVEASIARHVREGMGTSATRTGRGVTFSYDTDSDSDA